MKLSRGKKIALAAATLWSPIYMVGFLAFFLFMFAGFATRAPTTVSQKGFPTFFLILFPVHIFTVLLGMGVLVIYLVHALQNQKLDQNARLLWAILIFVGNMVTMPIYFFKYILPLKDDAS